MKFTNRILALLLAIVMVIGLLPLSALAADGATEGTYVKVTTAPADWSGEYLIVYEAGNRIFNGSLTEKLDAASNFVDVTITDSKITTNKANAFTIAAVDGGYSIQSASGRYMGKTSDGNGMNESTSTAYANTISLDADGNAEIIGSGKSVLRYNASSGQDRFRYFKSSTYTGQKPVALYKLEEATSGGETTEPTEPTEPGVTTPSEPITCEHTWGEWVEITAATCDAAGVQARECSECKEMEEGTIPALGHDWDEWITSDEPTCTAEGSQGRECLRCEVVETEVIPATGHTYVDGTCSTCGEKEAVYTLVTDASTLAAGDKLVLAVNSKACVAGDISGSYMKNIEATFSSDKTTLTISNGTVVFTLGGSEGAWTFANTNGELLGATAVKKLAWGNGTTTWTIKIEDGKTTITNTTASYGTMKYNASSPRFTTYASGQTDVQLYRLNTAATECNHTETTTTTVDATCIAVGSVTVTCDACGVTIGESTVIPALGHNFADGVCERCHAANIANDTYVLWMADGNAFTTFAEDKYYGDPALTALTLTNGVPAEYTDDVVFTLSAQDNGTWTIVDRYGRFIYGHSNTNYTNFNASTNVQSFGAGWLFEVVEGGYAIHNVDRDLYIGTKENTEQNTKVFCLSETPAVFNLTVSEPPCEHTNTVAIGEEVAATCTATGMTAGLQCADCGYVIEEQVEIAMIAHNYVDGICSVCNAVKPVYILTDLANIGPKDKVIITMTTEGGVTYALANDIKSSKPAAVAVTVEGTTLAEGAENLEWNIVQDGANLTIYVDESEASWLYNAEKTEVGVGNGTNSIFTIAENGYLYNTGNERYIGVRTASSPMDWRAYKSESDISTNIPNQTLGFYVYTVPCAHTNTEERAEIPATCTESGRTAGTFCLDCEKFISGGDVIEALGHTYGEDGNCVNGCGAIYPIVNNQMYYIAAIRSSGNYWYMTNDNADDRLAAAATELTALPESIAASEMNKVFVTVKNDDGTWCIMAKGVAAAEKYLGWSSGNSVKLVALEDEDIIKFIADVSDGGILNLHFTDSNGVERYLALNGTKDNDYFACYKDGQKQDLTLIPVAACTEHNPVAVPAVAPTCTETGLTEGSVCSACGEVLTAQEVVPATGHNYVDGICTVCSKNRIYSTYLTLTSVLQLTVRVDTTGLDNYALSASVGEQALTTVGKVVYIPAHLLNEEVTITLTSGETVAATQTWTLDDYITGLNLSETSKLKPVADALCTYADYAQAYAKGTDLEAVEATIPAKLKQNITVNTNKALKPVASLYLDDACDITVKFNAAAWKGYTLYINDAAVEVTEGTDQVSYTVAENLLPQDWGTGYVIEVKDAEGNLVFSVTYSAMSYAYAQINRYQGDAKLNNLLNSMYLYYVAAAAYAA